MSVAPLEHQSDIYIRYRSDINQEINIGLYII